MSPDYTGLPCFRTGIVNRHLWGVTPMFLCFNLTRETLTIPSSGSIRAADWKLETEQRAKIQSHGSYSPYLLKTMDRWTLKLKSDYIYAVISASGSFPCFFIMLSQSFSCQSHFWLAHSGSKPKRCFVTWSIVKRSIQKWLNWISFYTKIWQYKNYWNQEIPECRIKNMSHLFTL